MNKLALIVLIAGIAGLGVWFLAASVPDNISEILPPTNIFVDVLEPAPGASVAVGSTVPISAQAIGEHPLESLELWVDGLFYADEGFVTKDPDPAFAKSFWTWTAEQPGPHVLVARAQDVSGGVGYSNALIVNVASPSPRLVHTTYVAAANDTLEKIAEETGATLWRLQGANPGLDADQGLADGQLIQVPVLVEGSDSGITIQDKLPLTAVAGVPIPDPAPSPLLYWIGLILNDFPNLVSGRKSGNEATPVGAAPPFAPEISAHVNGCDVELLISPTGGPVLIESLDPKHNFEDGFFISRAQPPYYETLNQHIAAIGVSPAGRGNPVLWTDTDPPTGKLLYLVRAFNTYGATPSNPVEVLVPDDCAPFSAIALAGLTLQLNSYADEAYCYLSFGDGRWQRVPYDPFNFVPASEGMTFDLARYTSLHEIAHAALNTEDEYIEEPLEAECWGWVGGVLKFLGEGKSDLQLGRSFELSTQGFVLTGNAGIIPFNAPAPPGPPDTGIPAPFGLMETKDAQVCEIHSTGNPFLAVLCKDILAMNNPPYTVLTWEWQPSMLSGDIDGYVVKQVGVDGWSKTTNSRYVKMAFFPTPWPTSEPICYQVAAYRQPPYQEKEYSGWSQSYCLGGWPTAMSTVVLKPSSLVTHGLPQVPATAGKPEPGQAIAGLLIGYGIDSGEYSVQQTSAGIVFDLPSLPNLYRATLRFSHKFDYKIHPTNKIISGDKPFCANRLGYASGVPFPSYPVTSYKFLPFTEGPYNLEVNVTTLVHAWLGGDVENFGFVFSPDVDYLVKSGVINTNYSVCWSYLSDMQLELQYIPVTN